MTPEPAEQLPPVRTWRSDGAFMGMFALFACGVVGVDVFTVAQDRADSGAPVPLWEPTVWEVSSVIVLAALAPGIMALTRRFPPTAPPRFGWIAWHVAGALLFSLIHVTAMGVLRWAAYAVVKAWYHPLGPLGDWPYELRKDLLVYAGLVGLYAIWRSPLAGDVPAPDLPDSIEVRDGARRLFVPVGDILWVEAAGNYVELHRGNTPVLHRAPLSQMERRLAQAGFVRIHRSRLVRRAAIAAVETKASGDFTVLLTNGETLMGSRRFRAATRLDRAPASD